jgi:uncharacterized membrane protein
MAWAATGIVATSIATVTVGAKLTDTAIARNVFAVLVRKPRRRSAWSLQDRQSTSKDIAGRQA